MEDPAHTKAEVQLEIHQEPCSSQAGKPSSLLGQGPPGPHSEDRARQQLLPDSEATKKARQRRQSI